MQVQSGDRGSATDLAGLLEDMLAQAERRGCASSEHGEAARILKALGRQVEAVGLLERVTTLRPGSAADHEALGFAAFDAGMHQLSRDFYARVVEAVPNDALAWYNLATGDRNLGRLEEAEEACERALQLAPEMAQAALLRAHLRPQTPLRNHVDDLRAKLAQATEPGTVVFLHYALGKELDDLGEYAAAFDQFARGAAMRRSVLAYDVEQDTAKLQRIIESFDLRKLGSASSLVAPSYGFIIGLPRSGTTMIERTLTGSDHARSNGETNNLFGALSEAAAVNGADVFDRVANADAARVRPAYARRAGLPKVGNTILEKLPFNYLYAGAIRLTMPNARTLLVRRAPADNIFAMFSTLFGTAYPFSYSLEDLGVYYLAYRKLMAHWRAGIGEQWLEIAYEDMVADPRGHGPAVAAHFAIPWDDAMVRIENNKTASATASAAQIRRPIYQSARGRWRNYARELRPFTDHLEAAGIDPSEP